MGDFARVAEDFCLMSGKSFFLPFSVVYNGVFYAMWYIAALSEEHLCVVRRTADDRRSGCRDWFANEKGETMKKSQWMRTFGAIVMALVLVLSMTGCSTQKLDQGHDDATKTEQKADKPVKKTEKKPSKKDDKKPAKEETSKEEKNEQQESNADTQTSASSTGEKDKYHTDPVPEGQQKPVEPGDVEIETNKAKTCYLTISCKEILNNMDQLTEGKEVLVPADGILFHHQAVTFYEGESVFDVLQRETRNNNIHMSSRFTPMYNSAYIEAIGNLYERDCGDLSGWMYSVNGWYPNYGVSRYVVQEGDEILFDFTCDLGRDLTDANWME